MEESTDIIITTIMDVRTWLDDVRPDVVAVGLTDEVTDRIRAADHPAYGTNWGPWLATNAGAIIEAAAAFRHTCERHCQ